jgi:hypothetical protein
MRRPQRLVVSLLLVNAMALSGSACSESRGDAAVRSDPTKTPTPTASSSPSAKTRTYEGDGYSFSYPASWNPSEPVTGFVAVLISAPPAARQDGFLPNINVVLEPLRREPTTDEYFLASKQILGATFAGFELVDEGRTSIDGQPARWVDYTWDAQGMALRQRQAYQVRDDTGYVITLSASPSAFEEHLGSQLMVEESFRIA